MNSFTSQTPMAKRQNVTCSFDSFGNAIQCLARAPSLGVTLKIFNPSPSRLRFVKTCFDGQPASPCVPLSKPISGFRPRWNDGGLSACEGNGGSFKHLCILFMPCESHLIIPDSLAFLHLNLDSSSFIFCLSFSRIFLQLLYSLIVGQYDTSARRISILFSSNTFVIRIRIFEQSICNSQLSPSPP